MSSQFPLIIRQPSYDLNISLKKNLKWSILNKNSYCQINPRSINNITRPYDNSKQDLECMSMIRQQQKQCCWVLIYKTDERSKKWTSQKTVIVVLCKQNSVSLVQAPPAENTQHTPCKYSRFNYVIYLKVLNLQITTAKLTHKQVQPSFIMLLACI